MDPEPVEADCVLLGGGTVGSGEVWCRRQRQVAGKVCKGGPVWEIPQVCRWCWGRREVVKTREDAGDGNGGAPTEPKLAFVSPPPLS